MWIWSGAVEGFFAPLLGAEDGVEQNRFLGVEWEKEFPPKKMERTQVWCNALCPESNQKYLKIYAWNKLKYAVQAFNLWQLFVYNTPIN